jgi:hypothetical protein
MKAFKRREVTDLQHLRSLVADNTDAMEPDLKILASNLNLGRTTVELAALDSSNVPVIFVLGLTADDAMLVRALEAYAWCLEYPESLQRLVPARTQLSWPPRIVFVAERLLEAFVRKMRLLNFSSVECFEFRYVEANGTTGFYLERVDWAPGEPGAEKAPARRERVEAAPVEEEIAPPEEPRVAPREDPRLVLLRDEPQEAPQEEPPDDLLQELEEVRDEVEEPLDEPKVTPRGESRVIPLVPVEEPRIVMLHEPPPAPRNVEPPKRSVEPAPRSIEPAARHTEPAPRHTEPAPRRTEPAPRHAEPASQGVEPAQRNGGAGSSTNERLERNPVVLRGLRPPTEAPPRRRSREVPDVLRPTEQKPPSPREVPKPAAPPAAAAARGSQVEPRTAPATQPRAPQQTDTRTKSDAGKLDLPKNGAPKSDLARSDAAKGDLAPTWRKFLDRLTSTFEPRTTPGAEPPRAGAPPQAPPAQPAPLVLQPFAADIEVDAHEVAPDEVVDESPDATTDLNDNQRRALQGLTLPDNGELAPQWRKFLDHPTLDETKISVVRGYLQREFPLCTVYDFFDFQRNAQVFQLQDNHGKVTQLITMTAEFFDAHRDLEIRAWIEKHRLAQAMRQAGQAGVLVSQAGLQIEKR